MDLIFNKVFFDHVTGMHPESPKRLEAFRTIKPTEIQSGAAYLNLIHTENYIQKIEKAALSGIRLDHDTITSPGTWEAANYAVGATILASDNNDFALVRPPGHHAYSNKQSGFCFFNNIAIAAQKLATEGKKVLIFDFDGHLGDGTSHIFHESNQVMYWSQHQYPAFPGHGFADEIGAGAGKGFTINVPLPPHSGDDIFMDAVKSFLPIAKQFKPDVVAVSAGFDAHRYDPLLDLQVTAGSFYQIGKLLSKKFNTIFSTLEGGYSIMDLYRGILNFQAGINGKKIPFEEEETVSTAKVWETYSNNKHIAFTQLRKFWKV